jgi:hypothetical protein
VPFYSIFTEFSFQDLREIRKNHGVADEFETVMLM